VKSGDISFYSLRGIKSFYKYFNVLLFISGFKKGAVPYAFEIGFGFRHRSFHDSPISRAIFAAADASKTGRSRPNAAAFAASPWRANKPVRSVDREHKQRPI
jgi:hypothetical protein